MFCHTEYCWKELLKHRRVEYNPPVKVISIRIDTVIEEIQQCTNWLWIILDSVLIIRINDDIIKQLILGVLLWFVG